MAVCGRPKIDIDAEQLSFLMDINLSWDKMSALLGVSVSTLKRRADEYGLNKSYSMISDADLIDVIKEYLRESPNAGEILIRGHIAGLGLRVQRDRIRTAIHTVRGSQQQSMICRRVYSVPGPNSLWHVDGNHKLIRWRMVIHGGIDGYSRLITYLQCSNNNQASTVFTAFLGACEKYGTPSRVRSDKGGENVDIWQYMEATRGEQRGSYIAGPSVHNTRIERLWRDVYTAVTNVYVNIFIDLEQRQVLEPDNESDLFCLHFVFLPRINASLDIFTRAWNHHALSTEGGTSPLQLYTAGLLTTSDETVLDSPEEYGIDTDELTEDDDVSIVDVPQTVLPLSETSLDSLTNSIDPEAHSTDQGIDIYLRTVAFIHDCMQNDGLI